MPHSQVTKRCHWVPQSYLRGFAANPAATKIWRFSKIAGDPELKPIEKIAVRHHLYVPLDSDGKRDDAFEKKLANLEQLFSSEIWKLLQSDYVDLNWEPLRKGVSLLAANMLLRHPKQLEVTAKIHDQLVELASGPNGLLQTIEMKGERLKIDPSDWPRFRDATENDVKQMWISQMDDVVHYAEMLMGMRWSVLCSDSPVFITSDTPVTIVHPSLEFKGIMNPRTMIVFPISPKRVLSFDHLHHEPANQYYLRNEAAAAQNFIMFRGSMEHVFCHCHPDDVCSTMVRDLAGVAFEK